MQIDDISFIFNRAALKALDWQRCLLMSSALALCGLFFGFFFSLAIDSGPWMRMSLTFVPFFFSIGILLSTGVFMVRLYHDEVKGKATTLRSTLIKSWDVVIAAAYFSIPLILIYLVLWMVLGVVVLFQQMPLVGPFFSALIAFAPFLIHLSSLLLALLSVALLFFVAPALALKGLDAIAVTKGLAKRLKRDLFSNFLLATLSLIPLGAILALLLLAARMSGSVCWPSACGQSLVLTIRWLVTLVPFAAILSPVFVFFFHFSAEAHVLLLQEQRNKD